MELQELLERDEGCPTVEIGKYRASVLPFRFVGSSIKWDGIFHFHPKKTIKVWRWRPHKHDFQVAYRPKDALVQLLPREEGFTDEKRLEGLNR